MAAHGDTENPVEAGYREVSFTPAFMAQVDAARITPFGLSHLYEKNRRAVRLWVMVGALAVVAVPLIVVIAWLSSWWFLLALVLPPLALIASNGYGTVARQRMEFLHPLAVAQMEGSASDAERDWVEFTRDAFAEAAARRFGNAGDADPSE